MGLKYLISGSLYIITCISLYAMVKLSGAKIKSKSDYIALFSAFMFSFLAEFSILFHPMVYLYIGTVIGGTITFLSVLDAGMQLQGRQDNNVEWWQHLLILLGCIFLLLASVPLIICIVQFDLEIKWPKK